MNRTEESTPEPRQLRIDWTSATKRKLLTRLANVLKGQTLGDPDRPKECIKGSTIDLVMQGLHGWCVTDGWTDRKPAEICGSLGEPTVRRVLAYLQSDAAESCVAAEGFRYRNSPRVRRSICWSNLESWCEQLEAQKLDAARELVQEKHPLAAIGSPCRTEQFTLSLRAGHPLAAIGSYIEDGPKTVQTVPPTEPAERMSEADADSIEQLMGGEGEKFSAIQFQPSVGETTETLRHGEGSDGRSGNQSRNTRCSHSGAVIVDLGSRGEVYRAGEGLRPQDLARSRFEHSDPGMQPRVVPAADQHPAEERSHNSQRSEIERLLNQLGVEAAEVCVNQALRHYSIGQIEELVRYAAGEAIGDCQAWEPGFVFYRLTRPPSDAQGPRDGWAKRRPAWMLAKARRAERELRERQERRQRAERDLRTRRQEIEAFWGPVIDRLYEENRSWMWGRLTVAEQSLVKSYGGFRDRGVRDMFLLAAIEGRFEE